MLPIKKVILLLIFVFGIIQIIPVKAQLDRKAKNRAYFFAVNEYDKMRPLQNPIKDAKEIAQMLSDNYGFDTELLENPSLEDIIEKLREIKTIYDKIAKPEEQLLLYFTGHGISEFQNGFFIPANGDPSNLVSTALAYEYWRKFINSIDCPHILVMVDACFSGTFDPNWYSKTDPQFSRVGEKSEGQKLLEVHKKYKSRFFFTSGTEIETPDKSQFAKKLQEALFSLGGKDRILTSSEIYTFLELANPKPHLGDFGDDEAGSSFLFVALPKEFNNPNFSSALSKNAASIALEKAKNVYKDYLANSEDISLLVTSRDEINKAFSNTDISKQNQAWDIRGAIYLSIAKVIQKYYSNEIQGASIDYLHATSKDAGLTALDAFINVLENEGDSKNLKDQLTKTQSLINDLGRSAYYQKDYLTAYQHFQKVLDIHFFLKKNEYPLFLNDRDNLDTQKFLVALALTETSRKNDGIRMMEDLYKDGYKDPSLFESLYEKTKDFKYLEEGNRFFPENINLLFARINYHVGRSENELSLPLLTKALEKEPKNITLYITLGSIYNQLFQAYLKDKQELQAEKYFYLAEKNYKKGLEFAPNNHDLLYDLGSLYFNKAAIISSKIYDNSNNPNTTQEKEMFRNFDLSLPYFKRLEQLSPNDEYTLTALQAIYYHKGNTQLDTEFSNRLKKVKSGQVIKESYFSKN